MSAPTDTTGDPRCTCAHTLSGHPERYGLRRCTGHVLAVDENTDNGAPARRVPCGCRGFMAAPERVLREWGDRPPRVGVADAPLAAVSPRESTGRRPDLAPAASVAGDGA